MSDKSTFTLSNIASSNTLQLGQLEANTGPRSNMGGAASTEDGSASSAADDPSDNDQTAHDEIVTDSRPQPTVVDD